jgi:predicted RNA-binding protein with PUA-like domain
MARWLFKSEPSCYSFDDLRRDGSTLWDGITNAMARIHLRKVSPGDQILFYHTGGEKAVVGVMKATSGPRPDPNADDDKSVAIEVKAVRALPHPVSLARIKAEPKLASWDLVRQSRLSVMPVTDAQWQRIEELARETRDA